MKRFNTFQGSLEDGQPIMISEDDGDYVSYADVQELLEEIDLLAEAGLCQFSTGGKHAFLTDIRRSIAEQGIQGGLVPYAS